MITVMPDATAPVQPQVFKRCPRCGRVGAASNRCTHCLRDIAAVPLLSPAEAETALSMEGQDAAPLSGSRWWTSRRAWWAGTLGAVMLLVGWWVYGTFLKESPRPNLPSSAARSVSASGWATQDGDSRGTRSTSAPARLGGAEAWRVALGSPAATAPVTDGRIVVVPLQNGRLVGLDASSGKTLWTARLTLDNPPLSAPVIAGDRIYVAQREGLLMVLSVADGKEVWRSESIASSFEGSPLVADGIVYAYSTDGIVGLDAEDGRILWEYSFDAGWATVAPIAEGNHLVLATADKVVVLDRVSGQETFYLTFSRVQPSSVAIRDGEVVALYGRNASAFDASLRRPWWDRLVDASIGGETVRTFWFRFYIYGMAPPVPQEPTIWDVTSLPRRTVAAAVGQDAVVVTSPDGTVTALGRRDGKSLWTGKAGRLVAAPILTADGVLLTGENRLLLLDSVTGQQRAERKVDGLRAAIPAEGATYFTTDAGDLVALR